MNETHPIPDNNTRIGLHYFPDTVHYRESDLLTWLPLLKSMGVQWLTLASPANRAIPEVFITGLIENGIEPVLHLRQEISSFPDKKDVAVLLDSYASWGVNYIALFDRPNMQSAWSEEDWVQQNLIERYLDVFIPYAETVCELGMFPILSPLEPGGNFWDTAFLRSALQGIKARDHQRLLSKLVIGAYAWPSNRPLTWGSGGPERWPGSRPYYTPEGEEDQIGFRIFDWYNTLSEAAVNTRLPIILMGTGCRIGDQINPKSPAIDNETHAAQNLEIVKLLANAENPDPEVEGIPENVLAGNFWLLTTETGDELAQQAWFKPDGRSLSVVPQLQDWWKSTNISCETAPTEIRKDIPETVQEDRAIKHYLLLPVYDWGISEWHLEVTQPFIKKYKPTVGFSVEEACLADVVTVVGGEHSFKPSAIEKLKEAGCQVQRVSGDGTSIATQLEQI